MTRKTMRDYVIASEGATKDHGTSNDTRQHLRNRRT